MPVRARPPARQSSVSASACASSADRAQVAQMRASPASSICPNMRDAHAQSQPAGEGLGRGHADLDRPASQRVPLSAMAEVPTLTSPFAPPGHGIVQGGQRRQSRPTG